jgi:protein-S-isoprenylcysteine O-methyltransferase Ste14
MFTMPIWGYLLVVVTTGSLGVWIARRLRARVPEVTIETALQHARWPNAIPVALVLLLVTHFVLQDHPDWWWAMPPAVERVYLAALWTSLGALMALLVSFASWIAYQQQHPEQKVLVLAGVMLVGSVGYVQWSFTRPLEGVVEVRETPEGVVLQSTGATCAAATAANLLRIWGRSADERMMAERFNTTQMGTATGQVVLGLAELGLACRKIEVASPEALRLPAMLFVDHPAAGPESHAVALVQVGPQIEVWDPLVGKVFLSADGLAAIWHGRAVDCVPPTPAR